MKRSTPGLEMKTQADTGKMDLWIRQVTLMAMLLVALALILIGVALYAPRAHAGSHDRSSVGMDTPRPTSLAATPRNLERKQNEN